MKLTLRSDLGGYAAKAEALARIDGTEIDKPFVLLCGPNGAGKSAMLRMMRAATGVIGEREGKFGEDYKSPVSLDECDDDLGKMGAWFHEIGGTGVPKDEPGVIDVRDLGWTGQRTWMFSSRDQTNLLSTSAFDDDMLYHASLLVGGAGRSSHGQFLRGAWVDAQHWALGMGNWADPYSISRIPEARQALFDALADKRSKERWLFLDEPETAIDAEALATGLALLLENAEIGKLRVFCASHSFLFAAGMADHRNVQVVDLGGPTPWLKIQKHAINMAMMTDKIAAVAVNVEINYRTAALTERKAREDAELARVKEAVHRLGEKPRELLLKASETENGELKLDKSVSESTVYALERRKLVRQSGFGMRKAIKLTELGMEAAAYLAPDDREENSNPAP